jgi:hypothetical protein
MADVKPGIYYDFLRTAEAVLFHGGAGLICELQKLKPQSMAG